MAQMFFRGERLNPLWCVHTSEYYPAVTWKTHAATWVNLQGISKLSQSPKLHTV